MAAKQWRERSVERTAMSAAMLPGFVAGGAAVRKEKDKETETGKKGRDRGGHRKERGRGARHRQNALLSGFAFSEPFFSSSVDSLGH